MRYDQDFVKACSSNRTKLKDALLSPTVICPEFTIEMPLPSFTNILHKLEDLLVSILYHPNNDVGGFNLKGDKIYIDDDLLEALLHLMATSMFWVSTNNKIRVAVVYSVHNCIRS